LFFVLCSLFFVLCSLFFVLCSLFFVLFPPYLFDASRIEIAEIPKYKTVIISTSTFGM
jgi:hypothetical protein